MADYLVHGTLPQKPDVGLGLRDMVRYNTLTRVADSDIIQEYPDSVIGCCSMSMMVLKLPHSSCACECLRVSAVFSLF